MNIIDYVRWRGDMTMKEREYNSVDAMILCMLAYIEWDYVLDEGPKKLSEAYGQLKLMEEHHTRTHHNPDHYRLMDELAKSRRFGDLMISEYQKHFLEEKQQQFTAITIQLERNVYFIAFGGTDNSLVGWKEDFNMLFTYPVPSQSDALDYLTLWVKRHPLSRFYVGGHSKGGNMAMYAAMMLNNPRKILKVYNLDGPGFPKQILTTEQYRSIRDSITGFLPESSIIGRMFEADYRSFIVKASTNDLVNQHFVYSWLIDVTKPETVPTFSNRSDFFERALTQWYEELTEEMKRKTVNVIYSTLQEMNVTTVEEVFSRKFSIGRALINKYSQLDENTKNIMTAVIKSLISISGKNLFEQFDRRRTDENSAD